jgi:hypothetical protein
VKRARLAWGIAAVFILAFSVLSFLHFREQPSAPAKLMQFQITPPLTLAPEGSFALSPDGSRLAFAAISPDGVTRIWVRRLDSLEAKYWCS